MTAVLFVCDGDISEFRPDSRAAKTVVMPGLDPGIHAYPAHGPKDVDGRVKPGHDEGLGLIARSATI